MKEQLEQIRREALAALDETKAAQDLESLRVKYLGKKGELTAVLKQMGTLSAEERPIIGELANNVREALADAMSRRQHSIEEAAL
ncbi:MAG: phenylalanine--tRNA ligase subunit alpha, partial [Pseudoflavonifractor sp.]